MWNTLANHFMTFDSCILQLLMCNKNHTIYHEIVAFKPAKCVHDLVSAYSVSFSIATDCLIIQ